MKVTNIQFNRRYKTADYEHEDYTVTATPEDGETTIEVLAAMKADVEAAYSGETVTTTGLAKAEEKAPPKKPKKEKAVKEEVDPEEEEIADEEEEAVDPEDEEFEEEEEEKPKDKKKFKKKPQPYSRGSEQHKEIFSKVVLKTVAPDWRKTDDSKARAGAVSKQMEGKDFLDENGDVLEEFMTEAKKLMNPKKK